MFFFFRYSTLLCDVFLVDYRVLHVKDGIRGARREAVGPSFAKRESLRCGANMKHRALRLDSGNFSWGSEVCTRKVRVLDVTYNASNNELVRTKTLVKGAIILVDAHPFKDWYEKHYGVKTGIKKGQPAPTEEEVKKSDHVQRKLTARQKGRVLEGAIDHQFASGRLLARISSRPGQSGRCDGVILEGPELVFYQKMMAKK
jgi:small subunit ribosomal protein S8e